MEPTTFCLYLSSALSKQTWKDPVHCVRTRSFFIRSIHPALDSPNSLGILLKTLCDKMNAIGEIGYFLASFEAVIAHLQEIDLAEDHEGMTNIPLGEISLNE